MFWRKKRSLRDLDDEIKSHLALEADELRETAGSDFDSEGAALRAFGNATSLKEVFYERGRWLLWDRLSRDVRYALRLCWRQCSFSAVVIATLAVGIGATLVIFSVVNAVLLRPLPYKDPNRLAMLWSEDSAHGLHEGHVSLLNYSDWKNASRAFENMAVFIGQTFLLSGEDGTRERMRAARVSPEFFPLLGVEPVIGRVFSHDEEVHGDAVVVLSHRMWQQRFGASAKVLGSDLIMDSRKMRIIGVMPATFRFPFADTEVWEPLASHPYWASRDRPSLRSESIWYVVGRLHRAVSWTEAQAEMNVIARHLAADHPADRIQPEIRVVPLDTQTSARLRLPLAVLFGSVVLMLLIACLNVANLLLARGSAREREFSVRRALGASRFRIAGQLLVEGLVLSVAGGGLGIALAAATLKAVVALGPRDIPRLTEAHIDGMALLFTLALSLFAALFSGLGPVFNKNTAPTRSREWTTVSVRGMRDVIVVGEFAIAMTLIVGSGLMLRSFIRLQNVDPGFRPDKLLLTRVDLHVGRTNDQQVAYFREAIDRVGRLPGVRSAAAISGFLRSDPEDAVVIEGRPPQQPGPSDDLVAGPFFQTAGIALKRGRYFSDEDRANTQPVAIINEKMAQTYWPNEDPIGKRFRFPSHRINPWVTVVGVTGDMRRQGLETLPIPQVFRPHAQDSENMLDVIVRTEDDPALLASTVRSTIQSIDKSVAKFNVITVGGQLAEQTAERRFQTSLISLFSLIALVLSAIGIYGLMHYIVVQRTHEIGVRMALGARYGTVLALVVRQGLTLASGGIVVGIVAAVGFAQLLSGLLFGVTPTDPLTFASAPLILLTSAAVACWLPARRAAQIDPLRALRLD